MIRPVIDIASWNLADSALLSALLIYAYTSDHDHGREAGEDMVKATRGASKLRDESASANPLVRGKIEYHEDAETMKLGRSAERDARKRCARARNTLAISGWETRARTRCSCAVNFAVPSYAPAGSSAQLTK